MGKLSDQDYQQMKARYQEELAALLQEFERKGGPLVADHEVSLADGRCPRCGKGNPLENRFCGACGAELSSRNR
jgi:hypothetical protein